MLSNKKEQFFFNYYSFHNIGIEVKTNCFELIDGIFRILNFFSVDKKIVPSFKFEVIVVSQKIPIEISKDARKLYKWAEIQFFCDSKNYYIKCEDDALLVWEFNKNKAIVYLRQDSEHKDQLFSDYGKIFFLPCFKEFLISKDIFYLHAGAVSFNEKSVIITAPSGSGKSTLTTNLIRSGFKYLADDTIFLKFNDEKKLKILSFPEKLSLDERSIKFFPEILKIYSKDQKDIFNKGKSFFAVNEIYPDCFDNEGNPEIIVFPEIGSNKETICKKISKKEALDRLIPISITSWIWDKKRAEKHFDVLYKLVEKCESYVIIMGQEINTVTVKLKQILNE